MIRPVPTMVAASLLSLAVAAASCKSRPKESSTSSEGPGAPADANPVNQVQKEYISGKTYRLSVSEDGGRTFGPEGRINGYEAFANMAVGVYGAERMPAIFFRLIPELSEAGDPFKDPVKGFESFGFWHDAGESRGSLPLGFAMTFPSEGPEAPSYVIRTCASCHTGRVQVNDDGPARFVTLHGAGNHELRLHAYNKAMQNWIVKATADKAATKARLLRLVDEKHAADPLYFFGGRTVTDLRGQRHVLDAAFEAAEIEKFKRNVDAYLTEMEAAAKGKLASIAFLQKAYDRADNPHKSTVHDSPAGIADAGASGISSMVLEAHVAVSKESQLPPQVTASPSFQKLKTLFAGVSDPNDLMFGGTQKTKVPPLWFQAKHVVAQWDGNIRNMLFRNLVAALVLVGKPENLDLPVNHLVGDFIEDFPSPRYPFAVDAGKAERGRAHFDAYCAGCHMMDSRQAFKDGAIKDIPVFQIGTDPNRQQQMPNPRVFGLVRGVLLGTCQTPAAKAKGDESLAGRKPLVVSLDGQAVKPCEFDASNFLIPRLTRASQGYMAKPLHGVWARAPYLHNGSVPTLRHLLGDAQARPRRFITGLSTYDRENMGWSWDASVTHASPTLAHNSLDVSEDGFANAGHTGAGSYREFGERIPPSHRDKTYRMSFGQSPEEQAELDELLEYMKTL